MQPKPTYEELEQRVKELEAEANTHINTVAALRESEQRLALAGESAYLVMWDYNVATGEVWYSSSFADLLGYSVEEIEPNFDFWKRIVHPNDRQKTLKALQDNLEGSSPFYENEHRLKIKSGEWKWVQARGRVAERDADGNPLRHMGMCIDVTERVLAQQALKKARDELELRVFERTAELKESNEQLTRQVAERKKAEQELEQVFNMSIDMICIADIAGAAFIKVNTAFTETLGYSEEELLGQPFLNLIHPDDVAKTVDVLTKNLKKGEKVINFENRYRCKDGGYRWLNWVSHPLPEKGITYAVAHDITDRKEQEKAVRESEEQFRLLAENANEGIFIFDEERYLYVNAYGLALFGMTKEQFLSSKLMEHVHPEDREILLDRARRRRSGETVENILEHRIVDAGGRVKWVETHGALTRWQGRTATLAFARDITERKYMEGALRASEQKYKVLTESALTGVFIYQDDKYVFVNDRFAEMHGYRPEELIGKDYLTLVHPDQKEEILDRARKRLTGESVPTSYEIKRITKDGKTVRHEAIVGNPIEYEGRPAVMGHEIDITERKRMEEALKQSEQMYKMLTESALTGVFIHQNDKYVFVNDRFAEMHGYEPEELIGRDPMDLIHPDQKEEVRQRAAKRLQGDSVINRYEVKSLNKDGSSGWHEVMVSDFIVYDGRPALMGHVIDITERKRMEETLKQSEQMYKMLTESALTGVFIIQDGKHTFVNDGFAEMHGYKAQELIGMDFLELVHPDQREELRERAKKRLNGEPVPNRYEIKRITKDKNIGWQEVIIGDPIEYEGRPAIMGHSIDITERKRMEEALKQSEQMYKMLTESALTGVFIIQDGKHIFVNNVLAEMHGYTPEEVIGKDFLELIHPDQREELRERAHKRLNGEFVPSRYEVKRLNKDGSIGWQESMISDPIEYKGRPAIMGHSIDITERKRVEEALKESEQKYKVLTERALTGVYIHQDGRYVYVNDRFAEMLGYTPEEVIGKYQKDLIHPDEWEEILDRSKKRLNGEPVPNRYEIKRITKDGKAVWHEIMVGDPIEYRGRPAIMGHELDVTERKRVEEALKESEQKYKVLTERALTGVFIHQDDKYVYVNDLFAANIGYTPEELIGRNPFDFVHPDHKEEIRERARKRLSGERVPIRYEFKRITKSGKAVWHEIMVGDPIEYKGRRAIMGHSIDITERKRMEEALQLSEKFHRRMFEASPTPLFMQDFSAAGQRMEEIARSGVADLRAFLKDRPEEVARLRRLVKRTRANQATLDLYEAENEEEVLGTLDNFAPPGGSSHYIDQMVSFHEGKPVWEGQGRNITLKGNVIDILIRALLMPGLEEDYSQVLTAITDLTEIKRAQAESAKLEAQLRQSQKMEAVGTLAGGIAHDFNNILWGIIGFTEMALMDASEESELAENLNQVLAAGKRAKELVQRILDFSRTKERETTPVNLRPIVEDAAKLLRASLPSTIRIDLQISTTGTYVSADPTQIHQVLMNLGANARNAMEEQGGKLEIGLHPKDLEHPEVMTDGELSPGSYVEITVRDTGSGIEPDIIDRIFEPYFTTRRKGMGTGMGLAVVHGIVKSHSGAVKVESELGKGTVFRIFFPRIEQEIVDIEETAGTLEKGNERILFVDDEASLTRLAARMLGSLGYDVITKTNAMEALDLFRSGPEGFDLVVTDFTMPYMTGDKLAVELMAIRSGIPVILCTGYSEKLSAQKVSDLGIRALLLKPIVMKDLAQIVRKVLDGTQ